MTPTDDTALTYEQAREELIEVVRRLEQGGTTLEESLELWQRGERLATTCQQRLDGARKQLDGAIGEGATGVDADEDADEAADGLTGRGQRSDST